MRQSIPPVIDTGRCSGCGLCARVCPTATITMIQGRPRVEGGSCLDCDQCGAVCPDAAVTAGGPDRGWLPTAAAQGPLPGPEEVERLLRHRRSCREYRPDPLSRETLLELVRAGTAAPSGTNAQPWTFAVADRPEAVVRLGGMVADFYRRLNRLAGNTIIRNLSRLWLGRALVDYHRRAVARALAEYDAGERDPLFFAAPALILVATRPGAPCAGEDALLATQNILLAATARGLGTCLIGYAVAAMTRDRSIGERLGLPRDEMVRAVIALGRPALEYARPAGRRRPPVSFIAP